MSSISSYQTSVDAVNELTEERKIKEAQQKADILRQLAESGAKDRFRDELRQQLEQSGWIDEMKHKTKEMIAEKGMQGVTVHSMIEELMPAARSAVPAEVKLDLLQKISNFIQKNS